MLWNATSLNGKEKEDFSYFINNNNIDMSTCNGNMAKSENKSKFCKL